MTKPISSFTVQVTFNRVVYDVEITPLSDGKPLLHDQPPKLVQARIEQWNLAERTHQLFSTQISRMLKEDGVPAERTITLGSSEGFTTEEGLVRHKTAELWDEFIQSLRDPASRMASLRMSEREMSGEEHVTDRRRSVRRLSQSSASLIEESSQGAQEESSEDPIIGAEGPGAMLSFTRNSDLSLGDRKQVKFSVFRKKCQEFYCAQRKISQEHPMSYDEAEEACLKEVRRLLPSDSDSANPAAEARILWQSTPDKDTWSIECIRIRDQVAQDAKAAELRQNELAEEAARAEISRLLETPRLQLLEAEL